MVFETPKPPGFLTIPAKERARLRLFVFPHAGSGAYPYRPLANSLPPWVESAIAQLPGRETTFGAPAFRSMPPLVDALTALVSQAGDLPFVFFGHSFGAHVALAVARVLARAAAPLPRSLVVSSTRAPHVRPVRPPMHALPRRELIEELRRYSGTPEAVLQNEELMDLFLPPLRADLEILETYVPDAGEPLSLPVFAFAGSADATTRREDVEAWQAQTRGPFGFRLFEGGHFYLFEQSKAGFSAALAEIVTTAAQGAATST